MQGDDTLAMINNKDIQALGLMYVLFFPVLHPIFSIFVDAFANSVEQDFAIVRERSEEGDEVRECLFDVDRNTLDVFSSPRGMSVQYVDGCNKREVSMSEVRLILPVRSRNNSPFGGHRGATVASQFTIESNE